MIDDENKKKIVRETANTILSIEKKSLNQLSKPESSRLIDQISAKFEEVYKQYADNSDND